MPRLFYGNFDFEETLADPLRQQRSKSGQRLLAELAPLWIATAGAGDLIWCPEAINPAYLSGLTQSGLPLVRGVSRLDEVPGGCDFVPWGWTEEAVRFARQVNAECQAPQLDVVRRVNSRSFSHAREQESALSAIDVQRVATQSELLSAVESLVDCANGWVVKAEFGNSSRERFRHASGRVDVDRLHLWAAKRLNAGQSLFVEPWLERISEVGIQWEIPESGEPTLCGVTELLSDSGGHFRGCDFTPGREEDLFWQPAIESARETARVAQSWGYFGPLGVDAMCYRDSRGQRRLRAIQDINARWTMGRLSLAFRSMLKDGEQGCLLDCRSTDAGGFAPGSREVFVSPETINGRAVALRYVVVLGNTS